MMDVFKRRAVWMSVLICGAVGGIAYVVTHRSSSPVTEVAEKPVKPKSRYASKHSDEDRGGSEDSRPSAPRKGHRTQVAAFNNDTACAQAEIFGDGPMVNPPSEKQWKLFMNVFHDAKDDLVSWLDSQRSTLTTAQLEWMTRAVRKQMVQRPPTLEEPDLTHRGVVVMSEDRAGTRLIRLGGGALDLAEKNPSRLKFELARVLVSTWSPCTMTQANQPFPFESALQCLSPARGAVGSLEEACKRTDVESREKELAWMSPAFFALSSIVAGRASNLSCFNDSIRGSQESSCLAELPPQVVSEVAAAPSRVESPAPQKPSIQSGRPAFMKAYDAIRKRSKP